MSEKHTASLLPNTFQTPNLLVDRLMPLLLDSELRVVVFAYRHILGWTDTVSDRQAALSLSAFEHGFRGSPGCGLGRKAIINALDSVASFGVLRKIGTPGPKGQRWGIPEREDEINWSKLQQRMADRKARNRDRTAKASRALQQQRAEDDSSDDNGSPTPAVCPTNQPGSSSHEPGGGSSHEPTGSSSDEPVDSSSHEPNETHIETHSLKPKNPLAQAPEGAAPEQGESDEPEASDSPDTAHGLTVGQTVYWAQEAQLGAVEVHACTVLRFTTQKVWVRTAAGSEHCLSPRSLHAAPPKLERKTDPLQDVLAQRSFGLPPDATVGKQMMTVLNALKRDILASWPKMTPDELNRIYDEEGITPSRHPSILGMLNRHYAKKGENRDRSTKQTQQKQRSAKPRGRARTDAKRPPLPPALQWQEDRAARIDRELRSRKPPARLTGPAASDV